MDENYTEYAVQAGKTAKNSLRDRIAGMLFGGGLVEYETICKALEASGGHKGKAIDLLGISKRSFYMKLEKYHIK